MKYMLVRKEVIGGATTVRFYDSREVAIYEGEKLERVFEGSDWWVGEVQYTAYAPRKKEGF